MSRPKIKIQTTYADWAMEAIGLLGVALMIYVVVAHYSALPESIPSHFNAKGKVDDFGGKSLLLILLGVTIVTYSVMTILAPFPHWFSYPFPINEKNAERQYKNASLMIRILKTLFVFILLYLMYATIQNGLGKMHGLGVWFGRVAALSVLGTVSVFIFRAFLLR